MAGRADNISRSQGLELCPLKRRFRARPAAANGGSCVSGFVNDGGIRLASVRIPAKRPKMAKIPDFKPPYSHGEGLQWL